MQVAVVADPRSSSLTARVRNLLSDPEWADRIEINLVKDHFVFTIESTGALKPHELFEEALAILKGKVRQLAAARAPSAPSAPPRPWR